jgi:hypothetical protein
LTNPKEPGPTQPEATEPSKRAKEWTAPSVILSILGLVITSGATGFKFGQDTASGVEKQLREQNKSLEAKLETCKEDNKVCARLKSVEGLKVEAEINLGEIQPVWSRELFISVLSIKPNSNAAGYQTTAQLKAAGKEEMNLEGAAGDSTSYSGFEIRITEVKQGAAHFIIKKLDPPASQSATDGQP